MITLAALGVAQLERVTGLSTSSLYNAYGDKAGLHRRAVEHYNDAFMAPRLDRYAGPDATLDDLEGLFTSLLEPPLDDGYGCLLINTATELGNRPRGNLTMPASRTVLQPSSVPEVPYAQGIDVRGVERIVFVSGQIGTDDDGVWLDGVEAQTRRRVRAVLAEADLTMEDIVKLTIYLTDPADYAPFMGVAAELMAKPTAAVTGLVVPFLSAPEQKVEIEAIAVG